MSKKRGAVEKPREIEKNGGTLKNSLFFVNLAIDFLDLKSFEPATTP
jgi:hypothetical protein